MKEKMTVVGIQRLQGKSKAGNDYDFTNIKVLQAIQDDERSSGSGFYEKDITVPKEHVTKLLAKCKDIQFPKLLELTIDTFKNEYDNIVAGVTDIN